MKLLTARDADESFALVSLQTFALDEKIERAIKSPWAHHAPIERLRRLRKNRVAYLLEQGIASYDA